MNLFVLHAGEPEIEPLIRRHSFPSGTRVPDSVCWDAIFRWGCHASEPDGLADTDVLNPLRCVLRARHRATWREILSVHGIRTAESEYETGNRGSKPGREEASEAINGDAADGIGGYTYTYLVSVFHLQPLLLLGGHRPGPLLFQGTGPASAGRWRTKVEPNENMTVPVKVQAEPQTVHELPLPATTYHERRAVRQAVRAVYALGLDFANVRIGVTSGGRTLVTDIEPVPALDGRLAERLAAALATYAEEWTREGERRRPATLGADPEFLLRAPDGRIVPASRYLAPDGRAGSDAVLVRSGEPLRPLAELRPAPSVDPRELLRHLRETMEEAVRLIDRKDLAWLAGGLPAPGLPLGGHIHFGGGARLSSRLLRALDNYVALPLVLLESPDSIRRRPRYGYLGDFRRKPHGGFEYRTPPSWIGSPERALGILSLARLVVDHYRELKLMPLARLELLRAFYAGDKVRLLTQVEALWNEMERTWSYEAYRQPLECLKADCFAMKEWPEAEDIRPNWGIVSGNATRPPEKRVPSGGILL